MTTATNQTASVTAVAEQASAHHTIGKFSGTDNPRHLRVISLLLERPATRAEIDNRAGCANGPDLIAGLVRLGLVRDVDIECRKINCLDRDGFTCHPGVYHLTPAGRRKIAAWLATRGRVKVGAVETATLFGDAP